MINDRLSLIPRADAKTSPLDRRCLVGRRTTIRWSTRRDRVAAEGHLFSLAPNLKMADSKASPQIWPLKSHIPYHKTCTTG